MPRGIVATIEMPNPPALEPTETGAATQGPAYRLDVAAVSTEPLVITTPDGWTLSWRPTDLWYIDGMGMLDPIIGSTPSRVEVSGRLARYTRSFPSCDDLFVAEAERVKHYIVIHERPRAPVSYLSGQIDFCVSGSVKCRDPEGRIVPLPVGKYQSIQVGPFVLPDAFAADLAGERCDGTYEVMAGDAGQQLFMRIPAAWLFDPDRPYPVSIDPTVVPGGDYRGVFSYLRNVGKFSNGTLITAYYDGNTLRFVYSTDNGATWSPLGSGGSLAASHSYASFDLAIHHDRVHIVYVDADTKIGAYRCGIPDASYTGITWGPAIGTGTRYPTLAVHDDGAGGWYAHVVAYLNDLQYTRIHGSADGSYSIEAGPTAILSWAAEPSYPCLTVDSDWLLRLTVENEESNNDRLYYVEAPYSAGTWTWGAREAITTGDVYDRGPHVVSPDGSVYIAYNEATSSAGAIRVRMRSTGGSWTTITPSGLPAKLGTAVMALASSGDLWLGYGGPDIGGFKYMVRSADGTWGQAVTVSSASNVVGISATALGNLVVALYMAGSTRSYAIYSLTVAFNAVPLEPTVEVPPAFDAADGLVVTVRLHDEGDTLSGVYLQVGPRWWNGSSLVDSEPGAPIPASGTVAQITLPGGLWQVGQTYQITAATVDASGARGPYNSVPVVTRASIKPIVAILEPRDGATITMTRIPVRATMTVASGAAPASYRVAIYRADSGEQLLAQTYESSGALDIVADAQLPNGIAIQLGITPVDSDGLAGDEQRVSLTVSYVAPQPVFGLMAIPDATQAAIRLRWSPGDQPDVFSGQYEVYRDGKRIARVTQPESGDPIYIDRAVASGVIYTYAVRALGTNGTAGPFAEVRGVVDFEGWRFTPVDNPGNEVRFVFDWRARRQRDEDRHEVQTRGRYPVVFRGPSRPFRLTITAAYDGEGDLTVQEWADQIYSLSGRLGYLRAPDGGIWYGELHTPSDDWDRQLAVMARVITVQFVELGPVPVEV